MAEAIRPYAQVLPLLAGPGYDEVGPFEPIQSGQRNTLWRVALHGAAGDLALVVKLYVPEVDRFFDHHFRREEKLLHLLNRWFAGQVPRLYGGFHAADRLALLVMEDAGREALDRHLSQSAGTQHFALVRLGLDTLCAFHRVTAEHYQPFYRTCQSIDLDRLNAPTFARRLEVALGRVRSLHLLWHGRDASAADRPPDGPVPGTPAPGTPRPGHPAPGEWTELARAAAPRAFFTAFRQHVTKPLLKAPKGIVHNSFSPLHIILSAQGGPPRLIDFETLAVGPAQIDLAELLEAPSVTLDDADKLALAREYHQAMAGQRRDTWESFVQVYYCAAIARSLDYAGTTALRYTRYRAGENAAEAEAALGRHLAYLQRARRAFAAIGQPQMAHTVEGWLGLVGMS